MKQDPRREYKKGIVISILLISLGIAQLVFIVASRSQLIWRFKPGLNSGEDVITIPRSYLLPDRYIMTVMGYFPNILDGDVVGNITFSHQNTGKNYTLNYKIVGYLTYKKMLIEARSWVMIPGVYNVTWENNVNRFEYMFTTHGVFNFFIDNDRYPSFAESIVLVVSIFGLIAFLIASIKKYFKARRAFAYYQ